MFCKYCGGVLKENAVFCNCCGRKVEENEPARTMQTVGAPAQNVPESVQRPGAAPIPYVRAESASEVQNVSEKPTGPQTLNKKNYRLPNISIIASSAIFFGLQFLAAYISLRHEMKIVENSLTTVGMDYAINAFLNMMPIIVTLPIFILLIKLIPENRMLKKEKKTFIIPFFSVGTLLFIDEILSMILSTIIFNDDFDIESPKYESIIKWFYSYVYDGTGDGKIYFEYIILQTAIFCIAAYIVSLVTVFSEKKLDKNRLMPVEDRLYPFCPVCSSFKNVGMKFCKVCGNGIVMQPKKSNGELILYKMPFITGLVMPVLFYLWTIDEKFYKLFSNIFSDTESRDAGYWIVYFLVSYFPEWMFMLIYTVLLLVVVKGIRKLKVNSVLYFIPVALNGIFYMVNSLMKFFISLDQWIEENEKFTYNDYWDVYFGRDTTVTAVIVSAVIMAVLGCLFIFGIYYDEKKKTEIKNR